MLQEVRLARALAFNAGQVNESLTTQQVLTMATETGAKILAGPEPKKGAGWKKVGPHILFLSIGMGCNDNFRIDVLIRLEALVSLGKAGRY